MTDSLESQGVNRAIAYRTKGHRLGPITRLLSPDDLGDDIKPFVFLDLFEFFPPYNRGFIPHSHSGIATLTAFFEGGMTYGDTTGKQGSMSDGSVEWMRAGSGVWHAGEPLPGKVMRGFQLWVALPPELELASAESLYFEAEAIMHDGPARILLGQYNGRTSPVPSPASMTYLHVRLSDGQKWTYQPQADHDIAWLATNAGQLEIGNTLLERELAIFAEGHGAISITAHEEAEFVIGSAVKHPYPLIREASSVHTNAASLAEGERTIASIRNSPAFSALTSR